MGAALLLLAISPAISWAAYPGANGRIAYVGLPRATSCCFNVFTVLPSGAGVRQLTHDRGGEGDPSWSADGQRLVYLDGAPGALDFQVFTMSADGSNQTRVVSDNGEDNFPHFSPGGGRIVYAKDNLPVADSDTPRRVSIFTIRTDGTKRHRIVRHYADRPVWSPHGRRIAFDGSPNGARRNGMWTVRRDGSHLRRLTLPDEGYWDETRDWSPGGGRILFRRCHGTGGRHIDCEDWVMWADGSHEQRLGWGNRYIYSPAGDRFAYWAGETDDAIGGYLCTDIYTSPINGSDSEPVTHNCETDYGDAYLPGWQPIPQP